jgi:hypothetical protein
MAITLTGAGGLFTRLGSIFGIQYQSATYVDGVILGQIDAALADLSTEYGIAAVLAPARDVYNTAGISSIEVTLKQAAVAILNKMVNDDTSLPNKNDTAASIRELISQMNTASATVKRATTSISQSAGSANNGNGSIVITVTGPDGLTKRNVFAETARLICTSDSQTGGSTLGRESFVYYGDPARADFDNLWPAGSGAVATIPSIDSLESAGGNLLTNSSFETLASDAKNWTGWAIDVGVYNTDLTTEATVVYRGVKSLKIVGGATLTAIHQDFNNSTAGTPAALKPLTEYAIIARHKVDVVPAAGVLTIDLTDQDATPNVTADAQAVSNTKAITLSGLTTAWSSTTTTFRTPAAIPTSGFRLRVRITTGLSSGSNLYVDDLAMAEMTMPYPGGPLVAIFAGSNKWLINDVFTLTVANNRGGAAYGASFQAAFDRYFGMRVLNLQLPDASSPTIADTLITTP